VTNVLVGIDGSEGARRAAEFGRNVARAFNAHLTFLHVIERLPSGALVGLETPEGEWYARQMRKATELLADLSVDLQTPEAEKAIEMGHPVDVICREAQERNIDLIVVGRHGNRPGPRLILGSVGSNVAATTNCSVTIVQ
jgi:nucleotide-binding universal stress UspA family protein